MTHDPADNSNEKDSKVRNLKNSSNKTNTEPDLSSDFKGQEDTSESDIGSYSKPEATPAKKLNEDEIQDFFNKKGAIEILAQLADGPKRFSEIDNALVVSHGTVANRLTKGVKLNLWREYFSYPDDGGKIKLYELEPEAEYFAEITKEEEIDKTTERKQAVHKKHEQAVSNFQDRIKRNE